MSATHRVIFVNRFYWPDEPATAQLLTDLAEGLAARGFDITVITSHPGRPDVLSAEKRRGVSIHRIRCRRQAGGGVAARALDFLNFSRRARTMLNRILQPGDTLVMLTDPPLLGAAVRSLARRRQARVLHWIQDIYPEIAMAAAGSRMAGWLRGWRDLAWQRAVACAVLSEEMADFVRSRQVAAERVRVIPNWAPTGLSEPLAAASDEVRRGWGLQDRFVVGYSGNIGRVHDIRVIVDLALALRPATHIAFSIVGSGAQAAWLKKTVTELSLTNVHFFAPQPRERLADSLGAADLHLVTVREDCSRYVFPSKLYGIAAVARPVLAVCPATSDLARIVTSSGMGAAFPAGEIGRIADWILHLAREHTERAALATASRTFHTQFGGLARSLDAWTELLHDAKALAMKPDGETLPSS